MTCADKAQRAASTLAPISIHRRQRWGRFLLHLLLTLAILLGGGAYLCGRFRLGIDDQVARCLPPYRWYLIDTHDRQIAQGDLVAFAAIEAMAPHFRPGQTVIKRAVGAAGDRITVNDQETLINGAPVENSDLALAKTLGQSEQTFFRAQSIVPAEHLWVMGATRDSFDSRYWGMLPLGQVIGRAYALF